jgi:hypothetical protein
VSEKLTKRDRQIAQLLAEVELLRQRIRRDEIIPEDLRAQIADGDIRDEMLERVARFLPRECDLFSRLKRQLRRLYRA